MQAAHAPRRRLALALLAALLGACAGPVTLPDLPKQTPVDWRNPPAGDALGPAPDLDHWWRAFGDARLDALVERARAENLNVAQAQLRLRGARAQQRRSVAQYRPQVGFRTFAEPDPNGSTSYFEMGFDAIWELGLFGRRQADARIASADAQSAATDIVAARVSMIAEVVRNYMDLRAAQARAAILDAIVAQRRQRVTLAERMVTLKLGTEVDAERARADLAQARADAAEPPAAIEQAQQALSVLLAEPAPIAGLEAVAAQPQLPSLKLGEAPADLLRTRPEIRKAELNVLHAAGELGLARADLFPKLALGGSLISATRMVGDVDRPNKAIPSVGPVFDWTLFDWGARRDVIDARDAALQAAVLAYRQSVYEGVAEAESALAQLHRQRQRFEASEQSAKALERAAESARKLRGFGLADGRDVVGATLAADQARLEQSLARHDLNLAFIAVYKSFGGTLPPLAPDPH